MRIMKTLLASLLIISLMGCGIAQSVSETAVEITDSVFKWNVRTLHLDLKARAELNTDDDGRSSPVVIRIYQLKDADNFNAASYQELVDNDSEILQESLIESKEVVLKPDTSISIDTPFDKKADVVGVIALFKEPNLKDNSWRIVLERGDLYITEPREIIASQYSIKLVEEK
ncbi:MULTISPECIES: type VI secretion system lipoprotein TssJ [unclassified Gilliamella]|uniref:type VI secretion system lipoprotein TssJ n=1 Tax=unclassified Gilliamella TaxID=2685620 RepID=UPI002269AD21|nr:MULTISPECIES: type VI secretion system lipoprotein TssJ [unclassified Gilliamella]MCX8574736.1 type VI secretion system lipoprotein TssJ [Gilliamella sp. B3831]MCX8576910.1 type VI secretion system lipoprotein TssJ [Gilliamella sp. B3815]MCX8590460.1 type VI secretion system lipoprotein TssJ [Gilliamella sp. B3812]MCX8604068.1 type VI secretion system lipoprotein TssJ [Gilliamella sp. B3823]MCX8605799.1 type VI secretion system lipoprotein TssJ [Gilliamella sp. B3825]